jgi:NAD(P)H-dependent FMN reductase
MKKIVALGASNSINSINQKLAAYAASQIENTQLELIDLNKYEMPIFSIDREKESGIPEQALKFKNLIQSSDGIIISFAEHNGSYSAAFKNIFDWTSRISRSMWEDKPMFLLATSPGGRGGRKVLEIAVNDFPHRGGKVIAHYSLPSFHQNFSDKDGILDASLKSSFENQLLKFNAAIEKVGQSIIV